MLLNFLSGFVSGLFLYRLAFDTEQKLFFLPWKNYWKIPTWKIFLREEVRGRRMAVPSRCYQFSLNSHDTSCFLNAQWMCDGNEWLANGKIQCCGAWPEIDKFGGHFFFIAVKYTYTIKFTILTTLNCTVHWHWKHSRCCITTTICDGSFYVSTWLPKGCPDTW